MRGLGKPVKFLVTLSPAQREALRGAASSLGLDASEVVRRAVGGFLAERGFDFPDDLPARGDSLTRLMENRSAFISVANGRAIVARSAPLGRGRGWETQYAANWPTLEDDAAAAVAAQGGNVYMSGIYTCPTELAARAEWEQSPRGETAQRGD